MSLYATTYVMFLVLVQIYYTTGHLSKRNPRLHNIHVLVNTCHLMLEHILFSIAIYLNLILETCRWSRWGTRNSYRSCRHRKVIYCHAESVSTKPSEGKGILKWSSVRIL